MPAIDAALADLHATVRELVSAAEREAARWTTPRAPGKWSPSQVVEHVARIMEESANVASGVPSQFPTIPFFLRPFARALVFRRTLRRGTFPTMKAIEAFIPDQGSATPAAGRLRLEGALLRFDDACRACAAAGVNVASTIFGGVPVPDFARFQELHVRHHLLQLPGAA